MVPRDTTLALPVDRYKRVYNLTRMDMQCRLVVIAYWAFCAVLQCNLPSVAQWGK